MLLDAIGTGSMGQVYRASSKNDPGLYAVKVLPRRSMWNVRLARRQVRSFGQFQHPSVVPFVDVGTAGGLHYLVWPLVEGTTLEAMVAEHGKLPAEQAALIGVQVCQGLTLCQQNSIFHGLIKPSNVMLGADNQSRMLDFGIGCLLVENEGESLVDTMSTANTLTSGLDCAAPESIMDPTNRTPAGDQYSLGCTLYFCLTGRPPFPEGSAVEKMMAHQMKEPTPVVELAPDCPEGLAAVIAKLMAKKPDDRYSGTDEVAEALEPYLGSLAGMASASPAAVASGVRTPAPATRSSLATGGGGGPTARIGGGASAGWNSQTPGPKGTPTPPGLPARQPQPNPLPTGGVRASSVGGMGLPSRGTLHQPPEPEPVALTEDPGPAAEPNARSSTGWLKKDDGEEPKPMFGTLGVVLITVLVMAIVYGGFKFLPQYIPQLQQQQQQQK